MTPGTVYNQFACGCLLPESVQPVSIRLDELTPCGQKKRATACPDHPNKAGVFIGKIKVCPICEKTVSVKGRTGNIVPGPCRECNREGSTDTTNTIPVERYASPKRKTAAYERSDCTWRDHCIMRADFFGLAVKPCLGCSRYAPETVDVDVVMRRDYDPYEMAEMVEVV